MAAEMGFLGLGETGAKTVAGIGGVCVTTASILGSRQAVLTIWLVLLGLLLLIVGYCIENKHERRVKNGILLFACLCCGVAGVFATHSVNLQRRTSVTNTKSANQNATQIKNSAATQKDNSPAIAGGTGNSVSYGAPAESTTTHRKAKR